MTKITKWYLTREASSVFLSTSKLALVTQVVSWTHFYERLEALRSMSSHNDPSHKFAARILKLEDLNLDLNWDLGEETLVTSDESENKNFSISSKGFKPAVDEDDQIYFCATFIPGLTAWQFNKHDDDFFPSVPHGHWHGAKHPKLDAYLGWKYQGSTQIGREPRKKIIALWNNKKFREFAVAAIGYFSTHNKLFGGWRVSRPLRLPRRR